MIQKQSRNAEVAVSVTKLVGWPLRFGLTNFDSIKLTRKDLENK
jgi:hypothetical protein